MPQNRNPRPEAIDPVNIIPTPQLGRSVRVRFDTLNRVEEREIEPADPASARSATLNWAYTQPSEFYRDTQTYYNQTIPPRRGERGGQGSNERLAVNDGTVQTIPGIINGQKCSFQLLTRNGEALRFNITSQRGTNTVNVIGLEHRSGEVEGEDRMSPSHIGLVFYRNHLESNFVYGLELVRRDDDIIIKEIKP